MNKKEFTEELYSRLKDLPMESVSASADYYSEMIDDRIEEGLTEDEAVAALGSIEEITSQIRSEHPQPQTEPVNVQVKTHMKAWQIILIVLGFPLWFSLIAAVFIIVLAVYIVIWSVAIAFYAVAVSLIVSGFAMFTAAGALYIAAQPAQGTFILGAGFIVLGLGVLLIFPCNMLVKGTAVLTAKITKGIVSLFKGKEKAQ